MEVVTIRNSFNDLFDYIDDINKENEITPPKKVNKKLSFSINILAILLLVSGGYGIKYIMDQQEDVRDTELRQEELLLNSQKQVSELKRIVLEKEDEDTDEDNKTNTYRYFSLLLKENSDTIGWLYVPGTEIDMPIVQSGDNDYYLSHNFDKESSSMGWAFADYQNTFPDLSSNTIMYGHTYRGTTIFSNLKNVLNSDWLNNSNMHIITFDTLKERLTFQVFSVYTIEETNDYLYINFENKDQYQKYLDREVKRSVKDFEVEITSNDKILTLSTCYIDEHHRLVLHAKLIGAI